MNEAARKAGIEIALIGAQRAATVEALERDFTVHHVYRAKDPLAALREVGARVRGAASNGMAGISRAQIEVLPKLEICAINGVGLETSDVAACRERRITLTIAPVLYDDVADLAVTLALDACRLVTQGDRFVRAGRWASGHPSLGRKFTGARAGIIGLGHIGIEVARRLEAFKAEIAYVDPVPREVPYRRYPDAVTLAQNSDILFLCAAGARKGTAPPIVDRAVIDALGPRSVFVNIARGWLVDEEALVAALVARRLGAAGLDVFYDEPNVPAPLIALDNVVLTPHIASSTEETMKAMGECVVGNLVSWFAGRGALTPAR
ncbi:MAG: 2-hydroxyacid dehydrogenase [Methylobacteriaceae bacterium]|nr:2-hydroxyacid dehydrogenase [Methylobacteriaceae bacterium]MBV9247166.1 2-hydroxyacid dehydrogenase [Methylobacteriaceae bacterium]MBV9637717.1 2-hydroxyacid dehydrogenase [Methylobacteriaceae bacterium]MBV9704037.1 2-hydroxyacid dehydrogenase [Methylobacteriaceae bacterium]